MIDLQQFCDHGTDNRYGLHLPFVRKGKMYATDGRVAVCVPADGQDDTTPEDRDGKRLPKIDELVQFQAVESAIDWQPWPEPSPIINPDRDAWNHCPYCYNGIFGGNECNECDGNGKLYTYDGDSRVCWVCSGVGQLGGSPCQQCKGDYKGPWPTIQQVGSLFIKVEYDAKIRILPNVRWEEYCGSIIFTFDGGKGCVMPLTVHSLQPTGDK